MGKTCRSRLDDSLPLAQDHRGQRVQTGHFNGIESAIGTVQRSQFERIREPCGLMMTALEEKNEPNNRSILQSVRINSSNTITFPSDTGATGGAEQRFNPSLTFNNQRGFVQHSNR